jgi:hypothetical protein
MCPSVSLTSRHAQHLFNNQNSNIRRTHPTQRARAMANLRSISLDELSKRVSEAIIDDCGSLMDSNRIANAALYHLCEKRVDTEEVDVEDLGDAIEECFHEAIYEDRIEKIITQSLKNAGVTNDPPVVQAPNTGEIAESVAAAVKTAVSELRPQPSLLSMEVTALREQIMGGFPLDSQFISCCLNN